MGSDFPQRAGKTLKRSWDEGRAAVAAPNLFSREPVCGGRAVKMEMAHGARLQAGEQVTLQVEDGALVARRGLSIVGRRADPPDVVRQVIEASCNVRPGTVDEIHEMAGVVEISVC